MILCTQPLHSASRRLRACALALTLAVALPGTVMPGRLPAASAATTLRIWYATDDPVEMQWVHQLATAYMAAHRSVNVDLTTYGLDALNTKMPLALRSGNVPDLVYTTPRGPGLPAYVRAGKLYDMSAAAIHHGWASALRPGLLKDYNRLLAANGNLRHLGHIYAVPYYLAVVAVLYNKTIFQKLHLQIPHTLSEFAALLPRIKKARYTSLGFGNADGWVGDDWYLTLVNANVSPSTLAPALRLSPSFSFKATPFRAAAATIQNWANGGYFTPDFSGLDAQDSMQTFFEGRTAMQLISSTENSQIVSLIHDTRLNVGVLAFPSAQRGARPVMPQSGYSGWAIPTAARNKTAAIDFVDAMVSRQTASVLVLHGLLPALWLTANDTRNVTPFQHEFLDALASATPGVYLDSAPIPNINATMESNVQLLLQNLESPEFLTTSLEEVYVSGGMRASSTVTDGEF